MKRLVLIFVLFLVSFSLFAQSVKITADLSGRSVKKGSLFMPKSDFDESGIVFINIQVNKRGRVISALVNPGSTTITDTSLLAECRKVAQKTVFERRKEASAVQSGTIVYVFYENDASLAAVSNKSLANPLADRYLPRSFSLFNKPVTFNGAKRFKILQVIGDGYALAMSEVTERWEKKIDKSYKRFGDPVVLIVTEEPNAFYDDLVISVGVFQKTIQLGTYRYENLEQMIKTVPIIMIDSKF